MNSPMLNKAKAHRGWYGYGATTNLFLAIFFAGLALVSAFFAALLWSSRNEIKEAYNGRVTAFWLFAFLTVVCLYISWLSARRRSPE